MNSTKILPPHIPYTLPCSFGAIDHGKIFIGQYGTDPTVVANRIPIYIMDINGKMTRVEQPIVTNSAGQSMYNDVPTNFYCYDRYSIMVQNAYGDKLYFEMIPGGEFGVPAKFDFRSGGTVTTHDTVVFYPAAPGNNHYYFWEGALPKTVPANSAPTPLGPGQWVDVALRLTQDGFDDDYDDLLRFELGANSGATLVGTSTGENVEERITNLTPEDIGAQPVDATLTAMAGVTTAADKMIYFTGVDVAASTTLTPFARTLIDDANAAAARTTIGAQPLDATLTAMAGVTTAADRIIYFSGVDVAAATPLTAFGRTLIDDANATAARTTLGAQAADATLTAMAGVTTAADKIIYFTGADVATSTTLTSFGRSLIDDADAAAARATLGAQPLDATLTAMAGVTTAADRIIYFNGVDLAAATPLTGFGRTLIDDADAAAARTTLGAAPAVHSHAIADVSGLQGALDGKLSLTGGTMTGTLTAPVVKITGTPTDATDATTKSYVDTSISTAIDAVPLEDYLPLTGGNLTGELTIFPDDGGLLMTLYGRPESLPYIMGATGNVGNSEWYLGQFGTSTDVFLSNYDSSNYIALKSGYAETGVDLRLAGTQGIEPNSLTRRDFVETNFVNKAGDVMTGGLQALNFQARDIAQNMQGIRIGGGADYSEVIPVDSAGSVLWTESLRYLPDTGKWTAQVQGTEPTSLTTKQYVDDAIAAGSSGDYLPLTGGTITGNLIIDKTSPMLQLGTQTSTGTSATLNSYYNQVRGWSLYGSGTDVELVNYASDYETALEIHNDHIYAKCQDRFMVAGNAVEIGKTNDTGRYSASYVKGYSMQALNWTVGGTDSQDYVYLRYDGSSESTKPELRLHTNHIDVNKDFRLTGTQGTEPTSLTTKQYVDDAIAAGGGGMTFTELGDAVDLDTVTTPGYYQQSSDAQAVSGTHYPVDEPGLLIVYQIPANVDIDPNAQPLPIQFYYSSDFSYQFTRNKSKGGSWTAWYKIYHGGSKPNLIELGVTNYGLGTESPAVITDCNNTSFYSEYGGWYRTTTTTTNTPFTTGDPKTNNAVFQTLSAGGKNKTQFFHSAGPQVETWVRNIYDNAGVKTWGTWLKVFPSAGGGSTTLGGLTDVADTVTSATEGQVLAYNATSLQWEAKTPAAGGIQYINLANEDLNTITNIGHYTQYINDTTTTALHYPTANMTGLLQVVSGYKDLATNTDIGITQIYTGFGRSDVYHRYLSGTSWQPWQKLHPKNLTDVGASSYGLGNHTSGTVTDCNGTTGYAGYGGWFKASLTTTNAPYPAQDPKLNYGLLFTLSTDTNRKAQWFYTTDGSNEIWYRSSAYIDSVRVFSNWTKIFPTAVTLEDIDVLRAENQSLRDRVDALEQLVNQILGVG